jgi:DNA-binding transcriptional MerR regulator
MSEQAWTWKIGDLARATGLTVRTLHHYDQLGLLAPAARSDGGHRYYTSGDLKRLHRIVALRSLGISLEEIGLLLDGRDDPLGLLRRQLDVVDERIHHAVGLRAHLLSIVQDLNRMVEPSTEQLLALIEETVVMNERLTPERFAELKRERERHVSELSVTEFDALQQQMKRTWESLGSEERERLVAQRRAALPVAATGMTGERR